MTGLNRGHDGAATHCCR